MKRIRGDLRDHWPDKSLTVRSGVWPVQGAIPDASIVLASMLAWPPTVFCRERFTIVMLLGGRSCSVYTGANISGRSQKSILILPTDSSKGLRMVCIASQIARWEDDDTLEKVVRIPPPG